MFTEFIDVCENYFPGVLGGAATVTVFAPTNGAMQAFYKKHGFDNGIPKDLQGSYLDKYRSIFEYHMISGFAEGLGIGELVFGKDYAKDHNTAGAMGL